MALLYPYTALNIDLYPSIRRFERLRFIYWHALRPFRRLIAVQVFLRRSIPISIYPNNTCNKSGILIKRDNSRF